MSIRSGWRVVAKARTVNCGSSSRTVPTPVKIAHARARQACASARAATLVSHWLSPEGKDVRPSSELATFIRTHGRPRDIRDTKPIFSSRASAASKPQPADDAALLASVDDDPCDDSIRLIYADWLDEHQQPDRAALIRAQVSAALRNIRGGAQRNVSAVQLVPSGSPAAFRTVRADRMVLKRFCTKTRRAWSISRTIRRSVS